MLKPDRLKVVSCVLYHHMSCWLEPIVRVMSMVSLQYWMSNMLGHLRVNIYPQTLPFRRFRTLTDVVVSFPCALGHNSLIPDLVEITLIC